MAFYLAVTCRQHCQAGVSGNLEDHPQNLTVLLGSANSTDKFNPPGRCRAQSLDDEDLVQWEMLASDLLPSPLSHSPAPRLTLQLCHLLGKKKKLKECGRRHLIYCTVHDSKHPPKIPSGEPGMVSFA